MADETTKTRRWRGFPETVAYLDTTPSHLRRLVETRSIPHTKLGGKLRFDLDQIDAWLDDHSRPVAG